jgi:hypothetical protein
MNSKNIMLTAKCFEIPTGRIARALILVCSYQAVNMLEQ